MSLFRIRVNQQLILVVLAFVGFILAACFSVQPTAIHFVSQLHLGLQVPTENRILLLAPTITLLAIAWGVMKISPHPRSWSRFIIVTLVIAFVCRYLLWRSLSTLNLADPVNGVCSLGLLLAEILMLFNTLIPLLFSLGVKDRSPEADKMMQAVLERSFTPSVDILIPTYNEPAFILKRTILGCQGLEYDNKKIYLLDDTRRLEIEQLAEDLNCNYITRSDNRHAKAGNLNHAIAQTDGELIAVLDADFIPTQNFLTRVVGFFQDQTIALVQTPQSFYNADPIARNLELEKVLTPDEEIFYRQVQPIRDVAGSLVCSGTSFVVRRKPLEACGNFVTNSVTEDYFTGIRLAAKGYRLIYLNEKLSAGLATENIAAYVTQRMRWARGTLQGLFIDANPFKIKGLTWRQRLSHFSSFLEWFISLARIYLFLMPLAYAFIGLVPIQTTEAETLYFFLPFYAMQVSVFSWLNYRSRSILFSDVYMVLLCFPISLTVIQVLVKPFAKGFKVTPKGLLRDRYTYNWALASPLILLFVATAFSLWWNLDNTLGWLWSSYNLFILSIVLMALLDIPKPDVYEWFKLRREVQLRLGDRIFWGMTTAISEVGAEVVLTQPVLALTEQVNPISLEIVGENLELTGEISQVHIKGELTIIQIKFNAIGLEEHRQLVKILFCRPGQWQPLATPGELKSLGLLFQLLFRRGSCLLAEEV